MVSAIWLQCQPLLGSLIGNANNTSGEKERYTGYSKQWRQLWKLSFDFFKDSIHPLSENIRVSSAEVKMWNICLCCESKGTEAWNGKDVFASSQMGHCNHSVEEGHNRTIEAGRRVYRSEMARQVLNSWLIFWVHMDGLSGFEVPSKCREFYC